jgi:hypothetical protein
VLSRRFTRWRPVVVERSGQSAFHPDDVLEPDPRPNGPAVDEYKHQGGAYVARVRRVVR